MKPSKLLILYYFLRLRLSRRLFRGVIPRAQPFLIGATNGGDEVCKSLKNNLLNKHVIGRDFKNYWKKTLASSPFYRSLLARGDQFPVIQKQFFMDHFDEINTVGVSKKEAFEVALKSEESRDFSPVVRGISVGLSSGTSGNKGIFLTSPVEQAIWVGAILDRVIGWSFRKRKVAFFLRANNNLYESVRSGLVQFVFFDILKPMDSLVDGLVHADVDILVAQPSVLNEVARQIQAKGYQPDYRKVISVAEVLEEDQKEYFSEVFKCRIDQVYQCTEGFLAHTCKEGSLHFNEDWLTIEKKYLDEEKVRFHPIITDYLRRSQPVVRYELNDIIHEGGPCPCGSKMMTIAKIEGRSDDVFRFDTADGQIVVFPDFIRRAVIQASDHIINYQVIRVGHTQVKVALQTTVGYDQETVFVKVKLALGTLFDKMGIMGVRITLSDWEYQPTQKFKRIRNDYKPTI